ncbi:MAG: glycosyltransferase [Gammaproteobacteria bacterium]
MPGLCIAAVASERLRSGFAHEAELLPLTTLSWKGLLDERKPDLLLVEACSEASVADWRMAGDAEGSDLNRMLNLAKSLGIPTVLWNTEDHSCAGRFRPIARGFDYVFCADLREADDLRSIGLDAEVLLPAIQPQIFNPFRAFGHADALDVGVLYEGLVDLPGENRGLDILRRAKSYGLQIIESSSEEDPSKLAGIPDFSSCILGCVDAASRLLALKYSKTALFLDSTIRTKTAQQWAALETAACRVPAIHAGRLAQDDVRKGIVMEREDASGVEAEIGKLAEDDLYRRKCGQLGWRAVYRQHTFSHRLRDVCRKIGIANQWEEYPGATVVTPTRRIELLPRCLETFDRQSYPRKDLVLVINRTSLAGAEEVIRATQGRDDVQIVNVPEERYAGACLNLGNVLARGAYCLRVDDDDYYGENYLLDIMLHLRSVGADIFGKPPKYCYFEGEGDTYERQLEIPGLTVLPASYELWLSGNTLGGRKDVLLGTRYPDSVFGTADTAFFMQAIERRLVIASLDEFNMVVSRRIDTADHTWRASPELLKTKAKKLCQDFTEFMI